MNQLNSLIMALLLGLLLFLVHYYLPMNPILNLLFNCFMLVGMVIYLIQSIGLIKGVLPVPPLFKK